MASDKQVKTFICKELLESFLALFICALWTTSALAVQEKRSKEKEKVKKNTITIIDNTHQQISKQILRLSDRIDYFFGDKRIDVETNKSRVRIFTITTFQEGSEPETEPNFRVQLQLPRTEKRFQIVIERERSREETSSSGPTVNQARANPTVAETASENTTAALRYLLDVADINFSTDAGIRVNLPPQIFARLRMRKNINFGKWIFRPVEEILWLNEEGWSSDTDLNFDRRINDFWLFRFVNNVKWDDQDYNINVRNGPVFFQKISDKTGLSYGAYMFPTDFPAWNVENYTIAVGFRQLLYKEWFFWEISPALNFPRERNFHRTPVATIKFEVALGNI